MKRKFFVAVLLAVICVAVFYVFLIRSACPLIMVSKDFAYSRTQKSNVEYYNYEYSIRPLQDLLLYWNGVDGASKSGFLDKVKSNLRAVSLTNEMHLTEAMMDDVCGKFEVSRVDTSGGKHPIRCRLVAYAEDREVADAVVCAVVLTMLQENELENRSMAWKATMAKGLAVKRCEVAVQSLKNRLAVECDENAKVRLEAQIIDAERSVSESNAEWQSAVTDYRMKWDAVIECD